MKIRLLQAMKNKIALILTRTLSLSVYFIFAHYTLSAQEVSDKLLYNKALRETENQYNHLLKENLRLYNGNEFVPPAGFGQKLIGFPYFLSDQYLPGSVFYDGKLYNNINLKYELPEDRLIVITPSTNSPIVLHSEKIVFFTIAGHEFFSIPKEKAAIMKTVKHYYERIYNGNEICWVLRDKTLKLSSSAEEQSASFIEHDQYFLEKNNLIYPANSKNELLSAILSSSGDLRKFIRQNNLKFNETIESSIISVLQYIDQVKNN